MDDDEPLATAEQHQRILARYRQLTEYLSQVFASLYDPAGSTGMGILDELTVTQQQRWIAEVRELQRERTALEDLIVALARQRIPVTPPEELERGAPPQQ